MPCYSPLKGWKDRETGGLTFRREHGTEKMEAACGQCLGCRLDYSRVWAVRIVHEAGMHLDSGGSCFITLTYRDERLATFDQWLNFEYVPSDWSLHKEHMRNFWKRLRYHLGKELRYFYVGEYGRKCKHNIDLDVGHCDLCFVGRPHYHACLFGHTFDDLEVYQTDNGVDRYTSPKLQKIWKYGFVDVGELNYASAVYGASYILKKINGARAHDHYMTYDLDGVVTFLQPEYCDMSRGKRCPRCKAQGYKEPGCQDCTGGIGRKWYEKYSSDVFPSDEVPVSGLGVIRGVPRFYQEILKCEDPQMLEEIKKVRQEFRKAHIEEYSPERLMAKYQVKKAQVELFQKKKL